MIPLVILPSYNERDNLRGLIPAILNSDARVRILVVDDNSPDGTADSVRDIMLAGYAERLFLICRPSKLGLASAYIEAFKWGIANSFNFFIQMDADWSHSPKYLETMLSLAGAADGVIGSRYVAGGGTKNWSALRKFISKCGSSYARFALGLPERDLTGGFNGWHAHVLKAIDLDSISSNGYSFQIELKYRATRLGFRLVEFPIVFDERRAGKSKMTIGIVFEALAKVWQLKFAPAGIQPAKVHDEDRSEPKPSSMFKAILERKE